MGSIGPASWSLDRQRAARFSPLTPAEEAELAAKVRAGDQRAATRLITSNLRHVISIAHEYRRWGVPFDDLVQQGCLGLLKAAERFDPERASAAETGHESTLRSYAAYWIRAEIREYVVRGYRIVRLGTTRTERRAVRAFRTRGVDSIDELAEQSGMPHARCELLWPLLARGDLSLDFTYDGGSSPRERVRDERLDPEAVAMAAEERVNAHDRVEHALSELSAREQGILWSRLAIDEPETLEQIGKRLGVSRERVRQLETRAREKVRRALEVA